MWLVVGLGNPGRKYADTRHNAGFRLLKRVADFWGVKLGGRSAANMTATAIRDEQAVILALPQVFMNRTGLAVDRLMRKKNIPADHLVVVYDDLDISLGEIRVRKTGSPGTHKGMRSIVEEIATQKFPRIRIGIGPLPAGRDASRFVLSPFTRKERPLLEKSLEAAEEALTMILDGEMERAMNLFNRRKKD